MIIKNKKGQIGEALTWMPAFIIIFFIIMVSLFFTVAISKSKGFTNVEEFGNAPASMGVLEAKQITSFLDLNVNYNNENTRIKDLIESYYSQEDKSISSFVSDKLSSEFSNYYFYLNISKDDQIMLTHYYDKGSEYKNFNNILNIASQNEIYIFTTAGEIKINYFLEPKT